jgi:stress response protein YsnF
MLAMNKAYNMQEHIMYLTDSVQYINTDTIFEQIHDTVVVHPEVKVKKVYVIDTIKIQDTLYLQ